MAVLWGSEWVRLASAHIIEKYATKLMGKCLLNIGTQVSIFPRDTGKRTL